MSSMVPTPPAFPPVVGLIAEPLLLQAAAPNPPRKRAAEDGANGGGPAKRLAKTPDVMFRLLVHAGKIGKIIGKQGTQIKRLREETLANIKIADSISNTEDRVVLISSKECDELMGRTAAETALFRVADVLLEDTASASVGPQHQAPNLTRLLISGSQAGSLIGKGGASIQEIRDGSSANVRVLPSHQLPLCSAVAENDRLVQISGDSLQVHSALELIAANLRKNPPKEQVTPRPAYVLGGHQLLLPQALSVFPTALGAYPYAAAYRGQTPALPMYAAPSTTTGAKITSEMSIPNSLMGGIIGRGGANISQIRTSSGASIKVHGPKEGCLDRVISFEGSREQVTAAQSLVHTLLNAPR